MRGVGADAFGLQGAEQLTQQFPADDVRLYLTTLLCQDPETWGALEKSVAAL